MSSNTVETPSDEAVVPYRMNGRLRAGIIGGSLLVAAVLESLILSGAVSQDQTTGSLDGIDYGPGKGRTVQSAQLNSGFPPWATSPHSKVVYAARGNDLVSFKPDGSGLSKLATLTDSPEMLALSADGAHLATGSALNPEVSVFDVDPSSGSVKLRKTVRVVPDDGHLPTLSGLVISPDGSHAYLLSGNGDGATKQLISVDTQAGTVVSTRTVTKVPDGPVAVNPVTGSVYLTSMDSVEFLNKTTLGTEKTIGLPAPSNACCSTVSPDGKTLYVSNGAIEILDAQTGQAQGSIAVDTYVPGNGPGPIDVSPDGKILFSSMHDSVGLFDVEAKRQVGKVPLELQPKAIVKADPVDPTKALAGAVAGKGVNDASTLQTVDFSLSRTSWPLIWIQLLLVLILPLGAWATVRTSPSWVPRVRGRLAEAKKEAAAAREAAERDRASRQQASSTEEPEQRRAEIPHTNGFAIASLILGVVQASLLAVIFGHIARSQIRRTGEQGAGMAMAGLVLGYLSLAVGVGAVIWLVALGASIHH